MRFFKDPVSKLVLQPMNCAIVRLLSISDNKGAKHERQYDCIELKNLGVLRCRS